MDAIGIDITAVDTSAKFSLGTTIEDTRDAGPTKTYRYVKYTEGAAAADGVAGEVVYYPTIAVTDAAIAITAALGLPVNYSYDTLVTSDLSDSMEVGAGVLQSALTNGDFGWVQVGGVATLSIALTAGADGDPLTPTGSADGTLDVTALVTDSICATALDASAKIILCHFPH